MDPPRPLALLSELLEENRVPEGKNVALRLWNTSSMLNVVHKIQYGDEEESTSETENEARVKYQTTCRRAMHRAISKSPLPSYEKQKNGRPEIIFDARGALLALSTVEALRDSHLTSALHSLRAAYCNWNRIRMYLGAGCDDGTWAPLGLINDFLAEHLTDLSDANAMLTDAIVNELMKEGEHDYAKKRYMYCNMSARAKKIIKTRDQTIAEYSESLRNANRKLNYKDEIIAEKDNQIRHMKSMTSLRSETNPYRLSKKGDVDLAYRYVTSSAGAASTSTMSTTFLERPVCGETVLNAVRRAEVTMRLTDLEWLRKFIWPYVANATDQFFSLMVFTA